MKKFTILFVMILLVFSVIGCTNKGVETSESLQKELTISAAASLTEAMTEIKKIYESETDVNLTINFAASGSLQKQIIQGAPVDLFLSASKSKMDPLEEKGLIDIDTRKDLLKNKVVLIVSKEYKDKIKTLSDTKDMDIKMSIGEPQSVPAGKYAKQSIEYYQLWDDLKDKMVFAKDVKQVARYVDSGEAQAGIVYKTDAVPLKNSFINEELSDESHSPIVYPMAIIKDSKNKEEGKKFSDYLSSDKSKEVFKKYGFDAF